MEEFSRLVELMATLRGDHGCPWDKKQTSKAFRAFLLEEVYELIDAIEKDDYHGMKEELGDLLFHIVFISRICQEQGWFSIEGVIRDIVKKMYGRHPHVFSPQPEKETSIEHKWEAIKRTEKEGYSPVSAVPSILPALLRAYVISKRAAKYGFDWKNLDDVYSKVNEEMTELRDAEKSGNMADIEEELGDLLFTIVNVSRFHGIDPEGALRRANDKFVRRFSHLEKNLDLATASFEDMNNMWDATKVKDKKGE
jgi:tetrapyrrole methylase family protein / MazG family protein